MACAELKLGGGGRPPFDLPRPNHHTGEHPHNCRNLFLPLYPAQTYWSRALHGARRGRRVRRRRGAVPSSQEPRPTNNPLRKHLAYLQHIEHGLTQAKRAPNKVLTGDLSSLRDGDRRKKMMVSRGLWSIERAWNYQNRSRGRLW